MNKNEPNEVVVQFLSFKISARGAFAIRVVAAPIAFIVAALAWKIAVGF